MSPYPDPFIAEFEARSAKLFADSEARFINISTRLSDCDKHVKNIEDMHRDHQASLIHCAAYCTSSSMARTSLTLSTPAGISSFQPPRQTDPELASEVVRSHLQHIIQDGQLTGEMRDYLEKIKECRKKQRQEEVRTMHTAISIIEAHLRSDAPFTPSEREKYASFNGIQVDLPQESSLDELPTENCTCEAFTQTSFEPSKAAGETSKHAEESEEVESSTALHSASTKESATMAAESAEDLPGLTTENMKKPVKVLSSQLMPAPYNQPRDEYQFLKACETPIPEIGEAELLGDDVQWLAASLALPIASSEEDFLLTSDDGGSSDESYASSSSSPQVRPTTPDSEVSSPTSPSALGATEPDSPVAEHVAIFDGDSKASVLESEAPASTADSCPGSLSINEETIEAAENLQFEPVMELDRVPEISQSGSAAASDVAKGDESLLNGPTEDWTTDDQSEVDVRCLVGDGENAAADQQLPASSANEAAHSSAITEPQLESVIAGSQAEDSSALLQKVDVSGSSTGANQDHLDNGVDGAPFPGDLQTGTNVHDRNAGATQVESATIEGEVIGDVDIPDANEVDVHASASDGDATQSAGAVGPESNSAASFKATPSTYDSVMDSESQDDSVDEPMQDASPSSDDAVSLRPPAQDTDSFSTDVTSPEMEDATSTSAVVSSIPPQAASATPWASIMASLNSSQARSSSPTSDVEMAGADVGEVSPQVSLQSKQPAVRQPMRRRQSGTASPVSAEDVEMAFEEMFTHHPASSAPETSSKDVVDVVAADDSELYIASDTFPGTVPTAEASPDAQEASSSILAHVSSQTPLPFAAHQAASSVPAAPTVLSAATVEWSAATSGPEVDMSGTHDDSSSSGLAAQDIARGFTAKAISAAAQESSDMDEVQSSRDSLSSDAPSSVPGQTSLDTSFADTSSANASSSALVQSSSDTSSAGASTSALTHDPRPGKVPAGDPIWAELLGMGSKLPSYLKAEMKRGPRLVLPRNVAEYIQKAKTSNNASHCLVELLKCSASVTLPQLVALRDRAAQAQSRNAAARIAPPVVSSQPQSVNTADFLDVTAMLSLLRQIHTVVTNQPHIADFKPLFDLPWSNSEAMDFIIAYVSRNIRQANPQDGSLLIRNCNAQWYKSRLQPTENSSCNARWAEYRVVALRKLFEYSTKVIFELIQKGFIEKPEKPMTWTRLQERMQKEEGPNYFSTDGAKNKNSHESYMQTVFAYWKVPANVLRHIALASEADKPNEAPLLTGVTARKRPTEEQGSRAKRERVEPPEHIGRRRERDDGGETAEAPSYKRRHDDE